MFFSGRYKKIFNSDYDFLKLLFISLSDRPQTKDSKTIDEKNVDPGTEKFKTNLIVALEEEDKQELRARKINWSKLDVIKDFDHTEVQQLLVNAKAFTRYDNVVFDSQCNC